MDSCVEENSKTFIFLRNKGPCFPCKLKSTHRYLEDDDNHQDLGAFQLS